MPWPHAKFNLETRPTKGRHAIAKLETSHISRHANFQGITASHTHAVLEDLVQACIKDAFTQQRAKASAQVVLTEDKRKTVYQNLHTSLPSSITTSGADTLAIEISKAALSLFSD